MAKRCENRRAPPAAVAVSGPVHEFFDLARPILHGTSPEDFLSHLALDSQRDHSGALAQGSQREPIRGGSDPTGAGRRRLLREAFRTVSVPGWEEPALWRKDSGTRRFDAPLFILGIWRSGTTHLHNLFAQDDRFAFANNYQVCFPRTFLTMEKLAWEVRGPIHASISAARQRGDGSEANRRRTNLRSAR